MEGPVEDANLHTNGANLSVGMIYLATVSIPELGVGKADLEGIWGWFFRKVRCKDEGARYKM